MLQPRARWLFPDPVAPEPRLVDAATAAGVPIGIVPLLQRRGVTDAGSLQAFLGPAGDGLPEPGTLPDATAFAERVHRARRDGERILVFGDFDADGITGLSILTITLRAMGVPVEPYVPSRLDEGHGLSIAAVEAAAAAGAGLIITVDTGTSSVDEVAAARERGIDVTITDHHRVPSRVPAAVAIVNPQRAPAGDPTRVLSGAGVAFTLARLLLGAEAASDLADLAAIGTVADVAPLLGANRSIVRLGLDRIRTASRPGIAALLRRAGVDPAAADADTIGYALAPRLNAAGRVGEAFDAARLLLAVDAGEAEALATILDDANDRRRDLARTALAAARTSPDAVDAAPATVVRGPWPVGIVGLVAGRLAEERRRPAVVGAELGTVIRASLRGDGQLHLADAVAACDDLLIRHGGHAGAAGLEIRAEHRDAFRSRFLELAGAAPAPDPVPTLPVDLDLPALEVDYPLHRALERLAPFGTGNREPLIAIRGLTVVRAREASGGHAQLVLKRRLDVLDGIAFGWPELVPSVEPGDRIDVVARLLSRRFGGVESLQLEIRDAASAASAASEPTPGTGAGVAVAVGPGPAPSTAGRRP